MSRQDSVDPPTTLILKLKLPPASLLELSTPPPTDNPPKKAKMGKSNLGASWTEADIKQLWDLRQDKVSWNQIGITINRTGGAAQQQWMRMQREKHPLLANDNESKSPVIEASPKRESPVEKPDGKCAVCGKFGFVEDGEMVKCLKCQAVYHKSCHEPPVAQDFLETPETPWCCSTCAEAEASIGSSLAENLHTALDTTRRRKKRERPSSAWVSVNGDTNIDTQPEVEPTEHSKKRQRTMSNGPETPKEENEPPKTGVVQELDALRSQVQELEKDKDAMQRKLDEVVASQKSKDTEMDDLKDAIESLKTSLKERQPSSPLNGWLSKTKKRITGFGGAQA